MAADLCVDKTHAYFQQLRSTTHENRMHQITDHKVNVLNEAINVTALDEQGPGGANHRYRLSYGEKMDRLPFRAGVTELNFQNGPIKEAGVNGLSNEALLAVLIDRMRGFQFKRTELIDPCATESKHAETYNFASRGTYACRENACALTHLEEALFWLQKRTRDRMARNVEGTHSV